MDTQSEIDKNITKLFAPLFDGAADLSYVSDRVINKAFKQIEKFNDKIK